jgi:thiol-disulfide isomerase/thioredoxin
MERAEERAADEGPSWTKIVLALAAILAGFTILPRFFRPHEPPIVGTDAPDFTLDVVANAEGDQKNVTLSSLRGKPVLIDFLATWCGPCQVEAPVVNKVAQRFRERGLIVVGVNTSDMQGAARPWAKARGISFPVVFDEGDRVANEYGVHNLPTLVVVSRDGKVTAFREGGVSAGELERVVTQAL